MVFASMGAQRFSLPAASTFQKLPPLKNRACDTSMLEHMHEHTVIYLNFASISSRNLILRARQFRGTIHDRGKSVSNTSDVLT